jgi:biotin carboxylase
MRRIAVLSKKGLARRTYNDWLRDTGCEVVIFASDEDPGAREARTPVTVFPNWRTNPEVEKAVLTEHERRPLDAIVALGESDQVRAARLREVLGLPGQTPASAAVFRDKALMKEAAQAHGINVPPYTIVERSGSLEAFLRDVRWPVVIKPREGAGSAGVRLIATIEEFTMWADSLLGTGEEGRFIAEEFVDAPMVSVDGLSVGGQLHVATVSTYSLDCYSALRDHAPHGLLQLPSDDEQWRAACQYAGLVLAALPTPTEVRSFHCELFNHSKHGLFLCEIASRTGGGRINEIAEGALGVNLDQWATWGQAGVASERMLPRSPATQRDMLWGDALFLNPGRTLRQAPRRCPIPGVASYTVRAQVGEFAPPARKISEYAVDVLYKAAGRGALEALYRDVIEWVQSEVTWE